MWLWSTRGRERKQKETLWYFFLLSIKKTSNTLRRYVYPLVHKLLLWNLTLESKEVYAYIWTVMLFDWIILNNTPLFWMHDFKHFALLIYLIFPLIERTSFLLSQSLYRNITRSKVWWWWTTFEFLIIMGYRSSHYPLYRSAGLYNKLCILLGLQLIVLEAELMIYNDMN